MAGVQFQPLSMDDCTIHLHIFFLLLLSVAEENEMFSRFNTHGKLLKTYKSTDIYEHEHCMHLDRIFGVIKNIPDPPVRSPSP